LGDRYPDPGADLDLVFVPLTRRGRLEPWSGAARFLVSQQTGGPHVRTLVLIGLLLICAGVIGLTTRFISYTKSEKVAEIGPIEIQKEETKTIPIPELAAVLAVFAGIGLVFAGSRS
jgi:hypothetical protein